MADPRLRLRLVYGEGFMMGPGKADLLDHIKATGSISAAGRAMGMSYKRAWMLVETMNAAFEQPVVESARGGAGGGGASLTETGVEVLRLFRAIEAATRQAGADPIARLGSLLRRDMSGGK